jgi:Zn-dependent protease with chaperone function
MFVLRCLGVSFACFLLIYSMISLVVLLGWARVRSVAQRLSARRLADTLLLLRGLPFLVAAIATLAFVVPSFVLLEPRVVAEPVGEIPLSLGACCLVLLAAGVLNTISAQLKTSRTVAGWLQDAIAEPDCHAVPLYRIRPSSPALTVAGVCAPRVLLSEAAAAVLNAKELAAALKHEVAHVRRRDNLKKLLFRVCVFPGMAKLEASWSEAAEMAADDAAVSNSREALDLASALIKLSRFAPLQTSALVMGLMQASGSGLNARISRLVMWDETRKVQRHRFLAWYLAPTLLGGILTMVMTYSGALGRMHELTEWLVR